MNARLRHLRHSFFRQWRKWRKNRSAPLILPIVQWRNGAAKKQWRKKPEKCAIQNLLFKLLAFRAESLTSKKKRSRLPHAVTHSGSAPRHCAMGARWAAQGAKALGHP